MSLIDQSFFARDAPTVARELIGAHLRRDEVIIRITETEAYGWPDDSACHCYRGRTRRNAAMWGPAGHAYVYLCYGIHHLFNLVTMGEGEGSAVLIRAGEPVTGLDVIQNRRGNAQGPKLLNGPGKVGAALDLDTSWSHHPVCERGDLEIHHGDPPKGILVGPRVGIDYAAEKDRDRPWRFALANSDWVSHKTRLQPLNAPY